MGLGWIFELYQNDDDEHTFTLKDGADVTMLQGAGYVHHASAVNSIDLIRANAGYDACYEPSVDSDSEFYFYFTTPDRKVIAVSETFDSRAARAAAMARVKEHAPGGQIEVL